MLVRLAFETFPEVRMRNANQGLGTFSDRFPLQIDEAVLRDDVHHVGAWRGDDVALRQVQHDAAAALAAFLVSRRQADEGLAALRRVRASHELRLAARSADVPVPVRL